jgi:hypothetical protein
MGSVCHTVNMVRGRLLTESLRIGADLRIREFRGTWIGRRDLAGGVTSAQSEVWTYVDFEGPDDIADDLAHALADAMVEGQAWYADFEVAGNRVVVFPRRFFRYERRNADGRAEAVRYALGQGKPESQLWED